VISVKATYDEDNKKIILELTHNDKTEVIEASVRSSGMFRFSYHHPELDKPDQYHGLFLSGNKFIIYPILW